MFQLAQFTTVLRTDNPTYERVLRSALHDLVAILSRPAPAFTAAEVAAEMKRIARSSPNKWTKYHRTRAYLLREIPGLRDLERAQIVNFRTRQLSRGHGGAIVHVVGWESDTGSLADLAQTKVRERVAWPAPAHPVDPEAHIIPPDPENYRVAGVHFGLGNAATTPGSTGQGNDTHAAFGPFSPGALGYGGPLPLVVTFDQTYEVSYDNGMNWSTIPNSHYTIRRELRNTPTGTTVTITKANIAAPGDSLSNVVTIPR